MPSQVFHNQTIVFTLLRSRNTYAIGASGTFCLPYLRKLHAGDIDIPIETLIGIPIPNDGELFKWSGSVYVEYEGQDLLTPNRLEWSGSISKIEPTVIGHYLLSTDGTMGPIDPNATGSTPTFPSH
jgi:hypothetical protein